MTDRVQVSGSGSGRLRVVMALLAAGLHVAPRNVWAGPADIPESQLVTVQEVFSEAAEAHSKARQRLAVRRAIRSAEELLAAHPDAPNRFALLGTLYHAHQQLLGLDGSTENREALLDVCRRLVEAPDEYAETRFDAELLLSQTELARAGATPSERAGAMRPFIARYRDTSVEKKMLQLLTIMTLEWGNTAMLFDLNQAIAERFGHDPEMIRFQRDKLGGQVLSAPFVARLQTSDGTVAVLPMDRLGRSTVYFFWSKDAEDLDARIAQWNTMAGYPSGPKDADVSHRLPPELIDIVSLNLDDLPDAGASILREKGVVWQALHLPGGRDSELYRTYARWDPMGVHVSPSGCAALLLPGLHKDDYPRRVWSYAEKDSYYLRQLESLFMGEFLVVDPVADFSPAAPPELKAREPGNKQATLLSRTPASVPEDVLQAIQSCFTPPPLRYRLTREEALRHYRRAETLCRQAIAAHPEAPDSWLLHNRLIMALMGQWRMTCESAFLARAGEVAEAALALDSPAGAEVVPRLCLARLALRDPASEPAAVIDAFVEACGGAQESGAAVAAATYLALDVGNRKLHERYRRILLDVHEDNPMIWPVTAALLDRFHRYQMFMHPYRRGWSFGRREARVFQSGAPQDATRTLRAAFKTLDGQSVSFPDPGGNAWNVIIFGAQPKAGEKLPAADFLKQVNGVAARRDAGEVKAWMAVLSEDADFVATVVDDPLKKQTLLVPGDRQNPVVQRLGIYQVDERPNMAILRPDGTIAVVVSGLAWHKGAVAPVLQNTLELADEAAVDALLATGDKEGALRLALKWAPAAPAEQAGRKHAAGVSQVHLRCRAKVYIAMRKWERALADVDVLADRQQQSDAHLSLESPELLQALHLQAIVHERLGVNQAQGEKTP